MDLMDPASPSYRKAMVQCTFYEEPVEDRAATAAAGHAVYKTRDRVKIAKVGGNGQMVDELVSWVKTYPELWDVVRPGYESWKAGQAEPINGTALEMWPAATPAIVKILRSADIRTVEEVAGLQDNQLVFMGARLWRDKARAWLESARNVGQTAEQLADRDNKIAELQAQVAELVALAGEKASAERKGRSA